MIYYHKNGYKAPTIANEIAKRLKEEGIDCTGVGIYKFLIRFKETGSIRRKGGSGPLRKVTSEVKDVENQMQRDEMTAYQLCKILTDRSFTVSLPTIIRCRLELVWTFRGSAYCDCDQGTK